MRPTRTEAGRTGHYRGLPRWRAGDAGRHRGPRGFHGHHPARSHREHPCGQSVLRVPYRVLFPAVRMFCASGAYAVRDSLPDVYLLAGFGSLGYAIAKSPRRSAAPCHRSPARRWARQ
ncbi:hypothetical protein D8I35_00885 [Corticibacter populi]|uniref:DUF112 domain-containing protein n=1 Tax=Corticibacter populi TaxID=1550736 RepID=A0A3M6QXI3_9BURK|nr:hypothetical protein D8I35_00885 [Corticibacter populi]